ncbi:hypothetical protein PVAP13_5NG453040 [Panicum virgatum]|uniref:Uncharacterized protein n=1 Tax=Panicum virgatum TaxID=38727 RepID=A0A8T0RZD7_PANVG|nr:hypothetical protein PVAP13_5NG453040 [Panicum virgatum]
MLSSALPTLGLAARRRSAAAVLSRRLPPSIRVRTPSIRRRRALPRRSVAACRRFAWPGRALTVGQRRGLGAQVQGLGAGCRATGDANGDLALSSRAALGTGSGGRRWLSTGGGGLGARLASAERSVGQGRRMGVSAGEGGWVGDWELP